MRDYTMAAVILGAIIGAAGLATMLYVILAYRDWKDATRDE